MWLSIFLDAKDVQICVIELALEHEKGLATVVLPDTILESCLTDCQVVSLCTIDLVGHSRKEVPALCILRRLLGYFGKFGEIIGGVGICINSRYINS